MCLCGNGEKWISHPYRVCCPLLLGDHNFQARTHCMCWVLERGVGVRFPPNHLSPPHRVHGPWCYLLKKDSNSLAFPRVPRGVCWTPYLPLLSSYPHPRHSLAQSQRQWNSSLAPLFQPSHCSQRRVAEITRWVWERRPENMFWRWRRGGAMCKPTIHTPSHASLSAGFHHQNTD